MAQHSKHPDRQDTGARTRPFSAWPSWKYHPDYKGPDASGREDSKFARIFNAPDEVPDGWTDAPGKADEVRPPTAAELKLAEALAEIERLKAAGPSPATPVKKPTKAALAARADKIAKLIEAGYDAAEINACDDATLDATLAEEAKLAAKEAKNGAQV